MEFFDKLGKKASEAYKVTADKTGKIAKETKLKFKIGELRTQVDSIYKEIGKKVYEKHIREEEISIKSDLEEECTKIDVLSDEIEGLLKQCLELKDKKQCKSCYKEIEKDVQFCPNCGAKQTDNSPKEVEVLETLKDTEVAKHKETEKQDVINDLEEKIEDKKKTKKDKEEKTNLEKTVEIESDIKSKETKSKKK